MKSFISATFFILFSCNSFAQLNETITSDRPGQANSPFVVGKWVFQTQNGINCNFIHDKSLQIKLRTLVPNKFLRFGFGKKIDVNSAWEYTYTKSQVQMVEGKTRGLSLVNIGTRINLISDKSPWPSLGLQVSLKLPKLTINMEITKITPEVLLMANKELSDKLSLLVNGGLDFNNGISNATGVYVVNMAYSLSPKWGTFIESYGNFNSQKFYIYWDTGLAYLLNNNLQLDLYGGLAKNHGQTSYFTSIGLSWRLLSLQHSKNSQ